MQTYFTSLLSKFVAQLPATMGNFTETFTEAAMKNVTGTYSISGTYCTPTSGDPGNGNIQLLVHGLDHRTRVAGLYADITYSLYRIGFDSSYWDFAATDQDYSYVSAAAKAGHSTFRYDRLGTGLSEHPSQTYNVVQAATDVAILTEIISMLKNGKIGGKKFSKIAGKPAHATETASLTDSMFQVLDIRTGACNSIASRKTSRQLLTPSS